MTNHLETLLANGTLDDTATADVFRAMLAGELAEPVIAAYLVAWRAHGETASLLSAGARAMREQAAKVELPATIRPLADNCGTGGDGSNSFNVSTAAAIVAAAVGARVAKHGNRSISSKCGSADLLFAAGLPDKLTAAGTARLLEETGFTFFFAPNFHPAMRHVGPVRRALGVRTVFNLLGPLANPIAPEVQLLGVGTKAALRPVAEALASLGVKKALVVHSRDGMDELSPCAITDAWLVEGGTIVAQTFDPRTYGLKSKTSDLAGGDPAHNLKLLKKVLAGDPGGAAEAVALNAGALLWITGAAKDLGAGLETAKKTLKDRTAETYFARWLEKARACPTS